MSYRKMFSVISSTKALAANSSSDSVALCQLKLQIRFTYTDIKLHKRYKSQVQQFRWLTVSLKTEHLHLSKIKLEDNGFEK